MIILRRTFVLAVLAAEEPLGKDLAPRMQCLLVGDGPMLGTHKENRGVSGVD